MFIYPIINLIAATDSTTGDKEGFPTPVNVEKELPKGKYT